MVEKYLYLHNVLKRTLLLLFGPVDYRKSYDDSGIRLFGLTFSTGKM
jgi:hypothetical protein